MSRFDLPEGVPADNEDLKAGVRFSAPDMATPGFAKSRSEPGAEFSRVVVVVDEDDEKEEDEAKPALKKADDDDRIDFKLPMPVMIVGGAAVALVAFAYLVSGQKVEPQPYCSQQPEWNQYDCIPG